MHVAVEDSVVDGLVQVMRFNVVAGVQVGDGASDAEYLVVGSCRQTEIVDAVLHHVLACLAQRTVLADLTAGKIRIVDRTA